MSSSVCEAHHGLESIRNTQDTADRVAAVGSIDIALKAKARDPGGVQGDDRFRSIGEDKRIGTVEHIQPEGFGLRLSVIDDLVQFLVLAALVYQAAVERPAGVSFVVTADHEDADTQSGCPGERPIEQATIGVVLGACCSVVHSKNVLGFDDADVAANIRWDRPVGQKDRGNAHDITNQADRWLLTKVGSHVNVGVAIARQVVVDQGAGGHRNLDVAIAVNRPSHDRGAQAGVDLGKPSRILVFNSVKIQRSDIAVCLVDFENQSSPGVDGIPSPGLGKPESAQRDLGKSQARGKRESAQKSRVHGGPGESLPSRPESRRRDKAVSPPFNS